MTHTTATTPRSSTENREDVYTRVTNRIVADLENGVRPWLKPWNADYAAGRITRPLRHNDEPYKGINVLMLWDAAETKGYACPHWMTFKQAQELGSHVRKGEKGTPVVFASVFKKTEAGDNGEDVEREIPFLKEYYVFNCEQIEGLPEKYTKRAEPPKHDMVRNDRAEAFFANLGADIRHGGNRAFYSLTGDYVQLPDFEFFRDPEAYAGVKAHELTHWTRHESRLNRDMGRKQWGDAGYAMEELVAELGAAYLSADLEIAAEPREDHAGYIASWLEVLKGDKRAIFTAASNASRAVDFLHSLQPKR